MGLRFITLSLFITFSISNGFSFEGIWKRYKQQYKCLMPCSDTKATSCPPGYRCNLKRKIGDGVCVISDYTDTCYQVGLAHLYNGRVSETVNGIECQRWDSNTPHKPQSSLIRADKFPEYSVADASNYCRDPSKTGRPWCYTNDPNDRWDFCKVPSCSGLNCFRRGYAWLYEGHTNVTKDNVPCQRWNACYPHRNSHIDPDKYPDASLDEAVNFCRSPEKSATPWCYTTGSKRWQYCNIDPCPYNYCYNSKESWLYTGTVSRTQGGYECQNWDSQYPHKHKYGNMPMKFPENDVSKAKNYCRSPSWDYKPWCYTTDPKKRWDWCCINSCSDL